MDFVARVTICIFVSLFIELGAGLNEGSGGNLMFGTSGHRTSSAWEMGQGGIKDAKFIGSGAGSISSGQQGSEKSGSSGSSWQGLGHPIASVGHSINSIGGGIKGSIDKGVDDIVDGAGEVITGIGEGVGGVVQDIKHGAEDLFGKIHGSDEGMKGWGKHDKHHSKDENWNGHHKDHKNDHHHDDHFDWHHQKNKKDDYDHDDDWHHRGEHDKRTKPHWKTGYGIGVLFNDLLGLTDYVCTVSYAGEKFIDSLGRLHMWADKQVGIFDRMVVNYLIDNIVLKIVEWVRKYHLKTVDFFVDLHIAFDKLVTNLIIEIYRLTKAPIRELFACNVGRH